MEQNRIKLIALDMDGTLLTSDKTITPRTKQVLGQAMERGIYVVLCTGRSFAELEPELGELPGIEYVICANGANVVRCADREVIYQNYLPFDLAMDIYQALLPYDKLFEVYCGGTVYAERDRLDHIGDYLPGTLTSLVTDTRTPVDDVGGFLRQWNQPVEKVNMFFRDMDEKRRCWDAANAHGFNAASSIPTNLEINSPTSHKGDGLRRLGEHLHISREQMMAVGDNSNDQQMIAYAGVGIAMGNAIDSIKQIADGITATNDQDGVAKAVLQYAL